MLSIYVFIREYFGALVRKLPYGDATYAQEFIACVKNDESYTHETVLIKKKEKC